MHYIIYTCIVNGGDRALNPKLGGRSQEVTNFNSNARSDSFILLLTISQKRTTQEVGNNNDNNKN